MASLPTIAATTTPTISERKPRKFEMRTVPFPKDVTDAINKWLHDQIETRRKQLKNLHENKVPEWRRIASGKPREEHKSWPFENCANLVYQLVGQTCDDIAARVIGLIYATSPIAIFRYFTQTKDPDQSHKEAEKARILEQFMDYVCYEPEELDLYDAENLWFSDSAKLGTAFACVRPENRVEGVYVGMQGKKHKIEESTLYEGPKVQVLRFEDVLYDPDANKLEDSEIVCRKVTLNKRQLQERAFKEIFKQDAVKDVIEKPDRYGPTDIKKRENQKKGIAATEDRTLAEWDFEECYFSWYHNEVKYRLICWYHYETKAIMNCVFNYVPDNRTPIIRTRLSMDNHGIIGTGYAEMLKDSQDEVSTAKNQRTDAITWQILGINRISPANKNIDKNFKIFPGAGVPFAKDEYEHISVAESATVAASLENEKQMIMQAIERAGVGPAVSGMGTGQVNRKGQYGSMGTLAVLQESNTRANHRTSDFRHSHVKLIGLLTDFYGAMGLGRKGSIFGLDDKILNEALSDYLDRKVRIPIRAATASANKEVDKQNKMLLMQTMRQHTQSQTQLIQAIMNAGVPPEVKKWMIQTVKAQDRMMKSTLRDFQQDQPDEFVPEMDFKEEENAAQSQVPAGKPSVAEFPARPGGLPAPNGQQGMEEPFGGPPAPALPTGA
jgi:hypothetical protein